MDIMIILLLQSMVLCTIGFVELRTLRKLHEIEHKLHARQIEPPQGVEP